MTGQGSAHRRPLAWWTPLRLLLVLGTITFALGVLTKAPCAVPASEGAWWSPTQQYANACSSDLATSYAATGLAEGVLGLSTDGGRFPESDLSVPQAVLSYTTATVARALHGWPDTTARSGRSVDDVGAMPDVRSEAVTYVAVSALIQLLAYLLVLRSLYAVAARTTEERDASVAERALTRVLPVAVAPVVVVAGLIGWDLVPVALSCAAVWAWSAHRSVLAGIVLGLAVATALWPVVLLVTLTGTFVAARPRAVGVLAGATAVSWVVVGGVGGWLAGAGAFPGLMRGVPGGYTEGTLWDLLAVGGIDVRTDLIGEAVAVAWIVMAAAAFAYAARRRDPRRLPGVTLALLVGALAVANTYNPGQVLWLLPFAVLAYPTVRDPRWRDLLIWQGVEVFALLAFWWHLGGFTQTPGGHDLVYVVAVVARISVELWLVHRVTAWTPSHPTPAVRYAYSDRT